MDTDADGADVRRACTRKKSYPTEKLAAKVARGLNERAGGSHIRAYGCRLCGSWHIGHGPAGA